MKKILLAGKNPKAYEDLRRYFDPQDYTLLSSYDPKNPIASMTDLKPDLIILDLNSFPHCGIEIIKELKKSNSNLPVIAITDSSCDQASIRIMKEQVYGCVERPVRLERLSFMVKEALFIGMNRMIHTTATVGKKQKELKGGTKLSYLSESSEEVKIDCEKTLEGGWVGKKDYYRMFDHLLIPIYDEILVNSKGNIYDHLISSLEKSLISLTLKYCRHNQVKASQILGISRNTLRERIKKYDLW